MKTPQNTNNYLTKGFGMDKNLEKNLIELQKKFHESEQLIIKKMKSGDSDVAVIYIVGLNDSELLSKFVISPLKENTEKISSIQYLCENSPKSTDLSFLFTKTTV